MNVSVKLVGMWGTKRDGVKQAGGRQAKAGRQVGGEVERQLYVQSVGWRRGRKRGTHTSRNGNRQRGNNGARRESQRGRYSEANK